MSDATTTASATDIDAWAAAQPDEVILAVTLLGEARGEDRQGREMVASVMMTRVAIAAAHRAQFHSGYWWGETPKEVCLAHAQFDCWLPGDPNRAHLPELLQHPLWPEALEIAQAAIAGTLGDQANGATHYLNPHAVPRLPGWATPSSQVAQHLHHTFFRVV